MGAVPMREEQLRHGHFTAAHAYAALTGAPGWGFNMRWLGTVSLASTLQVDGGVNLASTLTVTGATVLGGGVTVWGVAPGSEGPLTLKHSSASAGFITLGTSSAATPDLIINSSTPTQLMRITNAGRVIVGSGSTATNAGLTVQLAGVDKAAVTTNGDFLSLNNNAGLYGRTTASGSVPIAIVNNSNVSVLGSSGLTTNVVGASTVIYANNTERFRANSSGVSFNGANAATQPDYTITNSSTLRTMDVSTILSSDVPKVLGTVIGDLIALGLFQ